jgi:hypothetical protein
VQKQKNVERTEAGKRPIVEAINRMIGASAAAEMLSPASMPGTKT